MIFINYFIIWVLNLVYRLLIFLSFWIYFFIVMYFYFRLILTLARFFFLIILAIYKIYYFTILFMSWLLYAWISGRRRVIIILNFNFFIINTFSKISLINFLILLNIILLIIPYILIILLSLKKLYVSIFYLLSLNKTLFFDFILKINNLTITYWYIRFIFNRWIIIFNKNKLFFSLGIFVCEWELGCLLCFPYLIYLYLFATIASSFSLLGKVDLRALSFYFRIQALCLVPNFIIINYQITLCRLYISLNFNNLFYFLFFLIWVFVYYF